jgi:hypothetical protein
LGCDTAAQSGCTAAAEEDEQNDAVMEGCSLEHKRRWRGGVTTVKGGSSSSSTQERRNVREGSVERGKGVGCSVGWSSPFKGSWGELGRKQWVITAGVMALMPLMARVVKEGVKPGV